GVEGFKTDGGEFLFSNDARLFDGTTGLSAHNRYPGQYIGAYQAFLRENGVAGVTFSRADYTGAHTRPLHWAGDQLSAWSELRAQLTAGISAGLSGVLFWGFDIGGFAGELPSAELYLRATAMGCFSPVMQWHAEPRSGQFYATHLDGFNNDRSPWNLAEKLGSPEVLAIATSYARLREKLRPYLTAEAEHCVRACRPMMAHLCLDFPQDESALGCQDEYMLGRRLLVAPIVREGAMEREVYLPKGKWIDFFTREEIRGGQTLRVRCPLERIPVYERTDAYE
ncbi:MAG: glycoside hydrolase, partial [Clostridiales bacterium]|nr:glycoside hydrolase [Clostridiales bacterium]